ncbi:K(+) efflux antiporter [Chloropicon primus]|nr:K(+) efflux antiporter [Chloropicon primus]
MNARGAVGTGRGPCGATTAVATSSGVACGVRRRICRRGGRRCRGGEGKTVQGLERTTRGCTGRSGTSRPSVSCVVPAERRRGWRRSVQVFSATADNESTEGKTEIQEAGEGESDSTTTLELNLKEAAEGEGESVEPIPSDEEGESVNTESDLWSFIGSSEDEDSLTDPWLVGGLSMDRDEEPVVVGEEDLPEDLRKELEKARGEKEELEVVRLKLESEAQDLAELAVEANEASSVVTSKVTEIVEGIANVEQEELEVEKDFNAAKKALKKALKKQKKKMARLDAAEETNAEAAVPDAAEVQGEEEKEAAAVDEESLGYLQKQVQKLEDAYNASKEPQAAEEGEEEEEESWLEQPASPTESGSLDPEVEAEAPPQTDSTEVDKLLKDVEDIKALEQDVLDCRDQSDQLAIERGKLENEVAQLELKSEELLQTAFECDQKANEAMEDVEKAVAAEMAAEARLEEIENKSEELIKDLIKQKKEEMKETESSNALSSLDEGDSPSIEKLEVEKDSVLFKSADFGAEEDDKKKIAAEEQVSALVTEATELLEEVSTQVEEVEESTAASPADAEIEEKAAPVPNVVVDAEPVSAAAAVGEKDQVEDPVKTEAIVIRRKVKKEAAKKNIFSDAVVRNTFAALALAATFGIAGKLAYNRGYVTKATQVFQAQVIDRLKPPSKKEEVSPKKKRKWLKRSKAKEVLQEVEHGSESGMTDTLWLLATCVVAVPLITKLPGGSPVLGFLLGGAFIGPNALGIINNVNAVKHIAELGVIFLLFNIGLELSFERLQAMQKYVFGLGFSQVAVTMMIAAWLGVAVLGLNGSGATILAAAMALSSTAVALQVLQDRGEASSRHGRATFSVLLFQDLAVVVFLMLTPLLAQSQSSQAVGGQEQVKMFLLQIGQAIVKACVAIAAIIAGGRVAFRPIYKRIAKTGNNEIFAATTLLVVLGTSMLTQKFGLSMELGAFIAGLLLAETEYALQIESDIAPYKGLLLGLFFMTVGMEFSMTLLIQQWRAILVSMAVLLVGKTAVVALTGPFFGLSRIASIRAGLMLAPGGEFAFVLLGDAAAKAILASALCSQMYLVVALGMALTPMLGALGNALDDKFENKDVLKLQPSEGEVDDLRGHVIVAGFGRVGQMICQLLSERLIPFTALDVRSDRVAKGRDMEMPVYFGDSGSAAVLHSIGASKAACAVVVLDTPGANYRCVWAIKKHYPNVKVYVRARDVAHGLNLERAGASAVVPETLEPSLQLAAAVLQEMQLPPEEVSSTIDDYRRKHLEELSELAFVSGSSLGYGYEKSKSIDVEA